MSIEAIATLYEGAATRGASTCENGLFVGVSEMELQEIRYFLALSDTLNFTRAAERCNVSQPALTRAIQHLEGKLGARLFIESAATRI